MRVHLLTNVYLQLASLTWCGAQEQPLRSLSAKTLTSVMICTLSRPIAAPQRAAAHASSASCSIRAVTEHGCCHRKPRICVLSCLWCGGCTGSTTARSACRWWCWAVRTWTPSPIPCSACSAECRQAAAPALSSPRRAAPSKCAQSQPCTIRTAVDHITSLLQRPA